MKMNSKCTTELNVKHEIKNVWGEKKHKRKLVSMAKQRVLRLDIKSMTQKKKKDRINLPH